MASEKIKSVCPYCGVGCGIVLEVEDQKIVKVSGDKDHPTNFGRLCTKGLSSAQALTDSGRMAYAHRRLARGDMPEKFSIDSAITETAQRLKTTLEAHGPDALSFYVSGQMSLEAQYLINKLAKGFVRTSHIESNSRLCMSGASSGYKLSFGADGPPGSYEDMEQTDLFFVIGANMADCHPILFLRLRDQVKKGAKLIVVDPRRTATAEKADLFLQIKPGTDLALLNGLLHLLIENKHVDKAFIAENTDGWDGMETFLSTYTPEKVSELTGIPEPDIRKAAQWIGEAGEWMSLWTMGLNQSTRGTWHTNALCNLHLATGALCRPGSGPFSLTGQPNAMGGREMGYMGPGLPGQRSVLFETERAFIENLWSLPEGSIRAESSPGTISMFEKMAAGDIKACWVICTNPVATVPNRRNVIAGLKKADVVICQDAYLETETNQYADILLPGALWAEGEGVMVNSERNLSLMQKAVDPPGEAMPDWQIIARVACEMGFKEAFSYSSAEEVFNELKQASNEKTGYTIEGASYERLRKTSIQWPAPASDSEDRNPIRYVNDGRYAPIKNTSKGTPRLYFPTKSGRGQFFKRSFMPSAEMPDETFPFIFNSGRVQHQWHTLTKTGKIAKLNKLNPGPFVEVHPDDAKALGLTEKDAIHIQSRRGEAILPAVITERVQPRQCFAPFHWNDQFGEKLAINDVTNDVTDPESLQPEIKGCAVALSRVVAPPNDSKEASPLSQVDTIAMLLGIDPSDEVALEPHEKHYMAGFIASLRTQEKQADRIPVMPASAPIQDEKRYWIDGLLAGMYSSKAVEKATLPPADRVQVSLLWASQTGNAEEIAEECATRLTKAGLDVHMCSMDEAAVTDLSHTQYAFFITSTFGDGEPPDNGESFWNDLCDKNDLSLATLQYAVLALGDSSYDQFCGFGKALDKQLSSYGAQPLMACTACDTDYQDETNQWINALEERFASESSSTEEATSAQESSVSAPAFSKKNPLLTKVKTNTLLNKQGSEKETRHYVFDLAGSGLTYKTGDALGVWPTNCPELVEELLEVVNIKPHEPVTLKDGQQVTIGQALLRHYEICRVTDPQLATIAELSKSTVLGNLLTEEQTVERKNWLWGRQFVDVVKEFPIQINAQDFIQLLRPLQPRQYSIASSPMKHPDEVHIAVSTVRYACEEKARKGVCSAFLADRANTETDVPIFIQSSAHFQPPENNDHPIIMVGAGTGIGPFRGFLQERTAREARGENWLIFGEQREALDFYFQKELEQLCNEGKLHRLDTAFSRDQEEKVYVQQRMWEHGKTLWEWLEQGAHFYVCGDAEQMAKDVDHMLRKIIAHYGEMSAEKADTYVKQMTKTKRYARDVY
ncbi:bifunctional nitrate reductase/sulfite reductase flavoprotein subunit alpha [Aureibacillus halotolerans]|uniref:assimilatory sulfite reductase (NADPH) n=1 Tax=Aureibacillus halotolerans TaxID=1508390 RepID=A0A4R6TWB2_9BACI|nr:bifunctional nitrate reductase/sulfite reductase flavoprotein subunit alpha [Aureibacillus halotolerans]TDQ37741.1 sulfite reductase (NADPH) alpha subunit [Aureibacillus halotolerans]